MGKIKYYIEKIVDGKNPKYMECLSDMMVELIEDSNYKDEYKMKLYGMANDYKFNEDMAGEIVKDMKPLGEYWNMQTTNQVKMKYGLNDISSCDFYIVMNSLVNDYSDIIDPSDVDTYVKMAKAFIYDEDAVDDKVWIYFTSIPKD